MKSHISDVALMSYLYDSDPFMQIPVFIPGVSDVFFFIIIRFCIQAVQIWVCTIWQGPENGR